MDAVISLLSVLKTTRPETVVIKKGCWGDDSLPDVHSAPRPDQQPTRASSCGSVTWGVFIHSLMKNIPLWIVLGVGSADWPIPAMHSQKMQQKTINRAAKSIHLFTISGGCRGPRRTVRPLGSIKRLSSLSRSLRADHRRAVSGGPLCQRQRRLTGQLGNTFVR